MLALQSISNNSTYQQLLSNIKVAGITKDAQGPESGFTMDDKYRVSINYTSNTIRYNVTKFPNAEVGDILYYSTASGENMDKDGIPVGICVIPGRLMYDGKTRFMSLLPQYPIIYANVQSTTDKIPDCKYGCILPYAGNRNLTTLNYSVTVLKLCTNILGLANYTSQLNLLSSSLNIIVTPILYTYNGTSLSDNLPSWVNTLKVDNISYDNTICYTAKYGPDSGSDGERKTWITDRITVIVPSPYVSKDESDINYEVCHPYMDPNGNISPLGDFDGYGNTRKMIYCDMLTNNTANMYQYSDNDLYPTNMHTMAAYAWNYHRYLQMSYPDHEVGKAYQPGDWYMPSVGEYNFVVARWMKIAVAFKNLRDSVPEYATTFLTPDMKRVIPTSTTFIDGYSWLYFSVYGIFGTAENTRPPRPETGSFELRAFRAI